MHFINKLLDSYFMARPALVYCSTAIIFPLGIMLTAFIGESRVFPIFSGGRTALRFGAGCVFFLTLMAHTSLLWQVNIETGQKLEFFRSLKWELPCMVVSIAFFVWKRYWMDGRFYSRRAFYSPSKIYHDAVAYLVFPFVFLLRTLPEFLYVLFLSYKSLAWARYRSSWNVVFVTFGVYMLFVVLDIHYGKNPDILKKRYPTKWMPIWETLSSKR